MREILKIDFELHRNSMEDLELEKHMIEIALQKLGFEYAKKYANRIVRYRYYDMRKDDYVIFDKKMYSPALSFESKVFTFEL